MRASGVLQERLLKAVSEGKIKEGDAIVIEAIDRITREDAATAFDRILGIVSAGVKIYTIEDATVYDKASIQSSACYVLVAKIHASYEYSNRLSQRVQAAYKLKREKAKAGQSIKSPNRPIWIDSNGALIEEVATAVRLAIRLYKQGQGQLELLKRVRAEFPDLKQVPATTRSIKRLLTNEALIGHWRGIRVFEPLIETEEYLELKQIVEQRAIHGKSEEKYLLSGLIVCKSCGANYNFRRQKPRATKKAPYGSEQYKSKGDIVYANCSAFLKSDRCSNSFTVPYEVAELVFERTSDQVLYSLAAEKAVRALSNKQHGELLAQKTLLESQIENRRQLFKALGNPDDLEELKHFAAELEVVNKRMSEQKDKLSVVREISKSPTPSFDDESPEELAYTQAVQDAFLELTKNTVNFRNALKEYGYQIRAGRSDDGGGTGVLQIHGNTYTIERRSQKLGCYLIKAVEENDVGSYDVSELQARRKPAK